MDPVLQAESLTIGYSVSRRDSRVVASELSLALNRGELVCLLGPNGAGKSTLLRTLAGLQPPLGGRVLLEGQDIHRVSALERARRIGVVLTERVTAGMLTGYDIVSLGRQPHTDWTGRLADRDHAAVQRAIAAVDAAALAGRQVAELSDGERQRIMVARAVAQEPRVMVLDEITAFLDLPRRVEIMRLLSDLAHRLQTAILMSTHDLELALRTADRLWLFDAGGRLQAGAPEDLVLAGAFEHAFAAEGVTFDRQEGAFKTRSDARGLVSLVGDGLVAAWTVRALERAGYRVAADHAAAAATRIEIHQAGGCPEWRMRLGAHTVTHASLETLVAELKTINAPAAPSREGR
jgi:iron complex transport system ATP-binding protein